MKPRFHLPWLALGAAASALLFSSCMHDASDEDEGATRSARSLFIATTDYTSGLLISFDADSLKRGPDSLQIFKDAGVFTHDSTVYVLERFGADNLLRYHPGTRQVMYQEHLGDKTNPSDIAFLNASTAFVTLENTPKVLKVNPATGHVTDSLDISDYIFTPDSGKGNAAASPHASAALLSGDSLFVLLQRRNGNWEFAGGPSIVLVIDTKTFTIKDTLLAPAGNGSALWLWQGGLYVACSGQLSELGDGGVYRWDRKTAEVTTVLSETDLGGSIASVTCNAEGLCYAGVLTTSYASQIRPFQIQDGKVLAALSGLKAPASDVIVDAKTGRIFAGERDANTSGLVTFDADRKVIGSTLKTGLPPGSKALLAP